MGSGNPDGGAAVAAGRGAERHAVALLLEAAAGVALRRGRRVAAP